MRWISGQSGARYRIEDSAFTRTGHSRLHRCRDDADADTQYVYKAYAEPLDSDDEVSRLVDLAELGRIADPTQPGYDAIGWPIDAVVEESAAVGVVLRAAPAGFLNFGRDPRTFDRLHTRDSYPPGAAVRIKVLLSICELFGRLEREGLVHGDISTRKILWRSDAAPHAYLLGCDGLHLAASSSSPDVDRLALAGLIYRGLLLANSAPALDEHGVLDSRYPIPPELDDRLQALFARAFANAEADAPRPTPTEWHEVLSTVAAADIDQLTTALYLDEPPIGSSTYADVPEAVLRATTPALTMPSPQPSFSGTLIPDDTEPSYTPGRVTDPHQSRLVLAVLGLAAIVAVFITVIVSVSHTSSPPAYTSSNSNTYPYQDPATYAADPGDTTDLPSDQATDTTDTQSTDQPTDQATATATATQQDAAAAQQQAQAISDLINNSSSDHTLVAQAVQTEVGGCTNASQGLTDLQQAVSDRAQELASAQQLDVSAIDNGQQLLSDLVNALQYSSQADQSYAAWAQDVVTNGCTGNAQPDDNYTAGDGYSSQATAAKNAFLQDWQPVATQFSLPVPTPDGF